MRGRLWGPLLIVVGLLAGSSAYARRDQIDLAPVRAAARAAGAGAQELLRRAVPVLERGTAAVRGQPVPWAAGATVAAAIGLALLLRRRRRSGEPTTAEGPESAPGFGEVLESALVPGGADGRRHRVLVLARDGRSVGEIARTTRLSQDAVRTVLDAG